MKTSNIWFEMEIPFESEEETQKRLLRRQLKPREQIPKQRGLSTDLERVKGLSPSGFWEEFMAEQHLQ